MIDPGTDGTLFMPPQASTIASEIDAIYYFVYYLSLLFFVAIIGGGLYFVWKYRYRPGGPKAVPISHHTLLEIAWSVLPLILLIAMFAWGYRGYLMLFVAPKDAYEIHVTGKRWSWEFQYPTGMKTMSELRVPVNRPVKLIMTSEGDPAGNVIHSFFVPAFRVKMDVLPNRYTTLWFEATRVGEFQVFCTEYCGAGHSDMLAKVFVMDQAEFDKWLKEGDKPPEGVPLAQVGEGLFTRYACVTCHKNSAASAAVIGPPLLGAFGRKDKLVDGTEVEIDENYIRESILRPAAKVVAGYQPVMPPFEGTLKDWQVTALIEYIKTLK